MRAPAPQQPATRHLNHLKRRHDLLQAILVCVDVAGQTAAEAQTAAGFETERGRDKGTRSALEMVPAEAMRVAARMLGSAPPAPRL